MDAMYEIADLMDAMYEVANFSDANLGEAILLAAAAAALVVPVVVVVAVVFAVAAMTAAAAVVAVAALPAWMDDFSLTLSQSSERKAGKKHKEFWDAWIREMSFSLALWSDACYQGNLRRPHQSLRLPLCCKKTVEREKNSYTCLYGRRHSACFYGCAKFDFLLEPVMVVGDA